MTATEAHPGEAGGYEIRVYGQLAPRWSAWLGGVSVTPHADGTTVLRGPVADQAALHGLLARIRDLGLPLVSVARLPADPEPVVAESGTSSPPPSPPAR